MLVRGLFLKLGRPSSYRILGDDIVIADDQVAKAYIELMEMIGVKINRQKSYSSSCYAEGAGFRVSGDVALAPGRFPDVTLDNYQSFIRDENLRREVLVSLPTLFDLPFKPNGSLTRASFIRIKAAMMADPSLKDSLTAMMTVKRKPFVSISTAYPDLFQGLEMKVDRKFVIEVKSTLTSLMPEFSMRARPYVQRVIDSASQIDTIVARDSQSLLDGIWSLKNLRRPQKFAPLESSFSILTLPPEEEIPKGYRVSIQKEKEMLDDLIRQWNQLQVVMRVMFMSTSGLVDIATIQYKLWQIHKKMLLIEYDPKDPYKAWWSEELLSSSLQGYSPGLDTPKARCTGLVVNEIYSQLLKVIASRGVLPSRLAVSNYNSDYRQLNNCIKLVGFKSLVRDYLI
jgi:hypothetical protein